MNLGFEVRNVRLDKFVFPKKVIVNGCGAKGGTSIPQIGWDFTPACNDHDTCYGTCNSDKDQCDMMLFVDISKICQDWWDGLAWWEKGIPSNQVKWMVCQSMGGAYFKAVQKWGDPAYNSAQNEACECKCSSKK